MSREVEEFIKEDVELLQVQISQRKRNRTPQSRLYNHQKPVTNFCISLVIPLMKAGLSYEQAVEFLQT